MAGHAVALFRRGALDTELAGVDLPADIRRYGLLQLWIAVPLALVVFACARRRLDGRRGRG